MRDYSQQTSGIISKFVHHRNAANLFMMLLLLFGFYGISGLNRQLMPTVELRNISISIIWSGASASDIEKNILLPLEPAVQFLDGVTDMSSTARDGSGNIILSFSRNTDMKEAEANVEAAVNSVPNLPDSSESPTVNIIKFTEPVASIGISGPMPEETLRRYALEIRDGLLDVGVDKVSISGYRSREIVIEIDDIKMRQLDVTLNDLSRALLPNITDKPSGALQGDFEAQIRAVAPNISALSIADAQFKSSPNGENLTFGDIAKVSDQFDDGDSVGFMRSEPAIKLNISRSSSTDAVEAYEKVKNYIDEISPTLPPSMNVEIFDAAAELVNDRLSLLVKNGLGGLAIVLVILFMFLNIRIAFWVAVGIPVSIMATLGIMYISGQTINMISMFALMMTLGIIVDDAIVVGEHTATRFEMGDGPKAAAINGAGRMAIPVIAASLTTMAAFGPILMVGDVIGQMMSALPLVVMAVLIASAFECFFVLPGHLAHALPKTKKKENFYRRNFNKGFAFFREYIVGWLIDKSYSWRYVTVAIAIAVTILGAGLLASGQLRFTLFPTAEGEKFNIFASFQPGTSQDEMQKILIKIEDAVEDIEEDLAPKGERLVQTTFAKIDIENGGASFDVFLMPSEERTIRTNVITAAIRKAIPKVAGVERIGIRESRGGPQGRAIDIGFSGANSETLKKASEELQDILEGFDGITTVSDTLRYGNPELIMSLTKRGSSLGFDLNNIGSQVRDAFEGRLVHTIVAEEEEIAILLEQGFEAKGSSALRELWLRAPTGGYVPLATLVTFSQEQGFRRINRDNGKAIVSVLADVEEGIDASEIIKTISEDYLDGISSKYGVEYSLGGETAERMAAFADLGIGAAIAFSVMYIIIAWIFQSYFTPIAVMLIIPFGSVGAIWGHHIMGMDLTIISLMGLLGLAGILVNDSIVLITRLQERLANGENLREASTGASRDRLRAVLLTSLTTIGGLTPLLFEKSLQAQFLIPMAVTIIFGLALATLLVLFLIPAFIAVGADIGAFFKWLFLTRNSSSFSELLAGRHHEKSHNISI
jgi:multidrug efflux pump subunit AcrB